MDQLELRLRTQIGRIERQLSPATITACQQVAWQIGQRLPVIMPRADWEDCLIREIEREFDARGAPLGVRGELIAAILMVIAAIIILIGTMLAKVEEAAQQKVKVKLAQLAEKLVAKFERQGDRTFRPVGRP